MVKVTCPSCGTDIDECSCLDGWMSIATPKEPEPVDVPQRELAVVQDESVTMMEMHEEGERLLLCDQEEVINKLDRIISLLEKMQQSTTTIHSIHVDCDSGLDACERQIAAAITKAIGQVL